jgi:large subunit ribosomal protein L28
LAVPVCIKKGHDAPWTQDDDVTLQSETLNRGIKLRITAAALRSVDHRGGLDAFLAKAKDDELSTSALKVKKEIAKAQAAAA